ncbi:MAG: tetratricopeptide repeat protein [Deltaproteobacteria bacterium]|nr:tetratricopeptide repeat protein [Deltaproteobacteria bacterium]
MNRSLLLAALVLALTTRAHAGDPRIEAKAHIDRATELHKAGNPAEALGELVRAYALDPQPQLLYAMGQLHVKLGECTLAITFYERFLSTKPAAQLARMANEAIATCHTNPPPAIEAPAEPAPVATSAPEPAPLAPLAPAALPRSPEPRPWYADKLGVGLAGAGVVTGIVGIVMWRGARSDRDDADRAPTYDEFDSLVARAQTKQTAALVLGVAGVVLVGAGGAHLWLHQREQGVVVSPTSGGAAISWSGRW